MKIKILYVGNVIALPSGKGSIHSEISRYYSSKDLFTGGKTVRDWLSTKSFKEQFEFGEKAIGEIWYSNTRRWKMGFTPFKESSAK